MKILVVEDHPAICEVIAVTLLARPHEVLFARDTDGALSLLEANRPDLAILDVTIPGWLDGYEICRYIRGHAGLHHTQVYMLTALDTEQYVQRGRQVGADRYFTKPFSPGEILQAIDELAATRASGLVS
jgi:DNA-binding response OmpR family regulator